MRGPGRPSLEHVETTIQGTLSAGAQLRGFMNIFGNVFGKITHCATEPSNLDHMSPRLQERSIVRGNSRDTFLTPCTEPDLIVCRLDQPGSCLLISSEDEVGPVVSPFNGRISSARLACSRLRPQTWAAYVSLTATYLSQGYGGDNIDPNPPSSEESSHKFWIFERLLSSSLLVICPLAFLVPSVSMDCVLATSLVLHNHWGCEAAVRDYLRPDNVGKFVAGAARGLIYVLSIAGLTGLLYFNTNDKGIVECLQMIWHMETASHPSSAGHT
uniref:Succinate dehydrogenase [ubiquinone] cytochrome b small subunit n=1 Tax=Timema genevievae TaxID=629358 RepID=A0A7R9JUB4_TIMGE|nr:unnamed protein product [Timema genevievae]